MCDEKYLCNYIGFLIHMFIFFVFSTYEIFGFGVSDMDFEYIYAEFE